MKDLPELLRDLKAADVKVRHTASRALEREARKVSVQGRKDVLGTRTVTRALISALGDTDRTVIQNAVIALAEISRRYFQDDRAYSAIVRLIDSPDQLTRNWAATAAITLRGEAGWPDVSPLMRDRSAKVRAAVILLAVNLAAHTGLSPSVRAQLQAVSEAAVGDQDQQVREYAVNLQRHLAAG